MASVFRALADPTRRRIVEALHREGGLSQVAIGRALGAPRPPSRQALAKHLGILRAAGVLVIRDVGRERRHHLVPSALGAVRRWLDTFGG